MSRQFRHHPLPPVLIPQSDGHGDLLFHTKVRISDHIVGDPTQSLAEFGAKGNPYTPTTRNGLLGPIHRNREILVELNERYILIEVKGRLPTVKWKKYNTSLPKKETSC
jgi:hypothetical protein